MGGLLCTLNAHPWNPMSQAEAIIANPVCYGHVHCAEKLQVPIHMLFTMPWTPTGAFPHPMVCPPFCIPCSARFHPF